MIDAKPLAGERILITGASSGLGAHFARLAVDAGAEVVVAARPDVFNHNMETVPRLDHLQEKT